MGDAQHNPGHKAAHFLFTEESVHPSVPLWPQPSTATLKAQNYLLSRLFLTPHFLFSSSPGLWWFSSYQAPLCLCYKHVHINEYSASVHSNS